MKAVSIFLMFLLVSLTTIAQSTKGFSFQGYARGADNQALQNEENLEVKFTLYSSNESDPEFVEEQSLTTNEFGIFQSIIGQVNTTDFNALDFTSFDYHLKVEVKDNGVYQKVAQKLLLAVPYSKASESAVRSITADKVKSGSNGVPPGTIMAYAGANAPEGWVMCNGSEYDKEDDRYKALYNVITNTYGESGSNFNVPDLRGVFPRGLDSGKGYDSGRLLGSYQEDAFKSHNHSASSGNAGAHSHSISHWASDSEGGSGYVSMLWDDQQLVYKTFYTSWVGDHSHSVTVNSSGGAETRPKNIAVNYIIKL